MWFFQRSGNVRLKLKKYKELVDQLPQEHHDLPALRVNGIYLGIATLACRRVQFDAMHDAPRFGSHHQQRVGEAHRFHQVVRDHQHGQPVRGLISICAAGGQGVTAILEA